MHITPHIGYYVHNGSRTDTVECYPPVDMRIENYENTVIDSVYHRLFGPLYKGWGQFAYHNNDTLSDGTIIHNDRIYKEKETEYLRLADRLIEYLFPGQI